MNPLRMIIFNTDEYSLFKTDLLQRIYSHLFYNYIFRVKSHSEYNLAETQSDSQICNSLLNCNLVILLIDSESAELYESKEAKELFSILSNLHCIIYPIHLNESIIEAEELDRIANDIDTILRYLPEYSATYFMLDYKAIINKIHDLIKKLRFTSRQSNENKRTIETKITIKINFGVFNIEYSRKETTDIKK